MLASMDINCDMGESFGNWRMGNDADMMPLITTANVACGFHASDPVTMLETVKLAAAHGIAVGSHPGLPDLLVWSIAQLPAQFPFFFGELRERLEFRAASGGHIGVTFDLGGGLFIPVVRDAAQKPLAAIAREMMSFRMKALRKSFKAEDLAGGDISISLNFDADTVFVQPIILPPQTCMVSVGAVLTELVLDAAGQPAARRYLNLGVAFDHRVINGGDANGFATAIKRAIEEPKL